jgi:SpoVK/Ycf46/Vps4 family AAA+-type ATPase
MGPEMHHHLWGVAEKRLRDATQGAQRLYELTGVPVTLFFDDCDSLFVSRGATEHFTPNMDMVNQFNALVDGVKTMRGVNLIAATNRIDLIDPAVAERFGKQKRINPPQTVAAAVAVLSKLLRDVPFHGVSPDGATTAFAEFVFAKTAENEILEIHFEEEDETEVVSLSELLSGRMLRNIVESAKILAKERGKAMPADRRVWALIPEDLRTALDRELRDKESLPATRQQVREWLRQRGDKREVDEVVNLREHRKSEARRERAAHRRVQ